MTSTSFSWVGKGRSSQQLWSRGSCQSCHSNGNTYSSLICDLQARRNLASFLQLIFGTDSLFLLLGSNLVFVVVVVVGVFVVLLLLFCSFKWLKYMAWSHEKSDGRLSTGKECKRAIKWSKNGISQWGKEISRITVPQREEFHREQGNNVLGEGNVYNYKWLISMMIFNLINLINSKANFTSRMCFAVGNKTRFVMLGLKY